jgi:hypothetical protein
MLPFAPLWDKKMRCYWEQLREHIENKQKTKNPALTNPKEKNYDPLSLVIGCM